MVVNVLTSSWFYALFIDYYSMSVGKYYYGYYILIKHIEIVFLII